MGSMTVDIGVPSGSTNDADGYVGVQIDLHGDGSSEMMCPSGEVHTPYGLYCRPLDPTKDSHGTVDPTQAGQAIYFWDGGLLHVIPTQDTRVTPKLPPLAKGESVFYGRDGQFVRCKNGGEISIFTTDDGTPNGKSIYFQVKPDGFTRTMPWGIERFDQSGFHVSTISGANFDLGGIGGIPGLNFIGSYAHLEAATIALKATAIGLGNTPTSNIALANGVIAALNAIVATMDLFTANVAANAAPLTGTSLALIMAPLFTATPPGTLATALTGTAALITSKNVTAS